MLKYELVIMHPARAKALAQRLASHFQSMATNDFGVNLDITYQKISEEALGLDFALRTNDMTQTSLNIRDKVKDVIQCETFIRPCWVEIQHVIFAEA